MNIIAVDDEPLALMSIEKALRKALPESGLRCFGAPSKAVAFAGENRVDAAFLDIEMGGMNGLELAKQLKDIYGKTNIVFVTGYSQYAVDSFTVPASGYIMKPVSEKAILGAVEHLRNPVRQEGTKPRIQCFGNFDVFADGEMLRFPRRKAKELLAYLVHKRGTSCTTRELTAVLFEDKEDGVSLQKQTQTLISVMMKVLTDAGIKDIVIRRFNALSIDVDKVDCDYYRFITWSADAVNLYTGEFMSNYSWAEFTIGYLDKKCSHQA